MICVKILKIGAPFSVKTKFGDKNKVNVVCEEQSTKKQYDTTMFIPKEGVWFKEGEEILADIEVSGQYVNIKKAEKMEAPPEPPKPIEKPNGHNGLSKEEWAAKELRDFRSRALAQVSSSIGREDGESELDWADRVIAVAELRFIDYIYNGYVKPSDSALKRSK